MHVYRQKYIEPTKANIFTNFEPTKAISTKYIHIPSRLICKPNSEAEQPKSAKAASRPAGANENKHSRPESIFQDKANR